MKISRVVLLMTLLLTFGAFTSLNKFVSANEATPSPDEEASVETEDEVIEEGEANPGTPPPGDAGPGAGEELTPPVEEPEKLLPAEDVEAAFVFTNYPEDQLPAGKVVQCLVSLTNLGKEKSYRVQTIESSIRFPSDFSYYLQNFTKTVINRTVEPNREATFQYAFFSTQHYHGRPFGFVVEVFYVDEDSKLYASTAFNKTVTFDETDEPFDMQAIMLYLLIGAMVALVAMIIYYNLFAGNTKQSKRRVETGTRNGAVGSQNEWLPNHARNTLHQSPKPKTTPKSAKNKSKKEN